MAEWRPNVLRMPSADWFEVRNKVSKCITQRLPNAGGSRLPVIRVNVKSIDSIPKVGTMDVGMGKYLPRV